MKTIPAIVPVPEVHLLTHLKLAGRGVGMRTSINLPALNGGLKRRVLWHLPEGSL